MPLLALVLVGPQLGLGRAALELVKSKASQKAISYTFFSTQSSSTAFQLQVAEAALMIDTAHLHAYRAAADIDTAATAGVYPDELARARIRADTGLVAEKITRAIDILVSPPIARVRSRRRRRFSESGGIPTLRRGTRLFCRRSDRRSTERRCCASRSRSPRWCDAPPKGAMSFLFRWLSR